MITIMIIVSCELVRIRNELVWEKTFLAGQLVQYLFSYVKKVREKEFFFLTLTFKEIDCHLVKNLIHFLVS